MAGRLSALLNRRGDDLFVPLAFGLSRRIEQAVWQDFVEDPTLATFALSAATKSLHADGVINWFDGWLEAESAGTLCLRDNEGQVAKFEEPSSLPTAEAILGKLPVRSAIDVAARLCRQVDDQGIVLGYMSGPATMLARVGGAADGAGRTLDIMLALAKEYFEAGVSGLLLADEIEAAPQQRSAIEALRPLFNLAEYYETPIVYLPRRPPAVEIAAALSAMGARIAAAGGDRQILTLPVGEATADDCVALWRQEAGDRRRLVLSAWDVPAHAPPQDVIAIAQRLKRH
jgi:hypothetical protein